jgi:pre-mRNA cleavage complex 2 protein Pcf11
MELLQVDEKTRACLFKMRNTWAGIFPATKLYSLDARVQMLDPAWPIAPLPTSSAKTSNASSSIHVNPKFLQVIIPYKSVLSSSEHI